MKLHPETELYLGLVHRDDMDDNAARLAAARRHVRVDGVPTDVVWRAAIPSVSGAARSARADRRTGNACLINMDMARHQGRIGHAIYRTRHKRYLCRC